MIPLPARQHQAYSGRQVSYLGRQWDHPSFILVVPQLELHYHEPPLLDEGEPLAGQVFGWVCWWKLGQLLEQKDKQSSGSQEFDGMTSGRSTKGHHHARFADTKRATRTRLLRSVSTLSVSSLRFSRTRNGDGGSTAAQIPTSQLFASKGSSYGHTHERPGGHAQSPHRSLQLRSRSDRQCLFPQRTAMSINVQSQKRQRHAVRMVPATCLAQPCLHLAYQRSRTSFFLLQPKDRL